jgi:hypothetical protein
VTTDTRLALFSQEQQSQAESLGELRHAMTLALRRLEQVEQEVATLKAAWAARFEERKGAE